MSPDRLIPLLLTLAWLAPLAGAVAVWAAGRIAVDRSSRLPAWVAVGAMAVSLNLALVAGLVWSANAGLRVVPSPQYPSSVVLTAKMPPSLSGMYYTLGEFGDLTLSLDYYIDSLTLLMFAVVTLIATAVHVYAVAYMGGETGDRGIGGDEGPAHDHHVPVSPLPPPPLPRFFAFLQLFTFAMLGLVLAGNLLQVFVFWELVGATSYFLIGFYFDRAYAAAAATKAFVMNRIGDAGFLIGIAVLWTAFGTLTLGSRGEGGAAIIPGQDGDPPMIVDYMPAPGVLGLNARAFDHGDWLVPRWMYSDARAIPRWWLVLAGLCLFAGCVGKSAQLPLSTWLPDAMAGPTPVSALVHSATMVAAGVYLVGRVYPLFLPEVLLVIAYVGAATLVYGATCAVAQTDLKRILAYSTVSQLGYMMLALGVGGREAGLFHLVTHAFFKSLLFLAAGSVIVACHHVQDLSQLGGLRKRMPLTAYTALVGVIAIAGLAVPVVSVFGEAIALSGYHSKDSILAAALTFARQHPEHGLLFALPLVTAGLTAFYMFRFWLLAFAGEPRDEKLHRHVKESSPLMTVPLVLLALFAAFVAIGGEEGPLFEAIGGSGGVATPPLHAADDAHYTASLWGLLAGTIGAALALVVYGAGLIDVRRSQVFFGPVLGFFRDGWRLDAVYDVLAVRPVRFLAFVASLIDRFVFDVLVHGVGRLTLAVSRFDRTFDERVVDGLVDRLAEATYATGRGLRNVQTGHLRQYVMALAAAAAILFALAVVLIPKG